MRKLVLLAMLFATPALARPIPDMEAAPIDVEQPALYAAPGENLDAAALRAAAQQVLRVSVKWNSNDDTFAIESLESEPSGTDAFVAASRYDDRHGSFKGKLLDANTGEAIAYSVVGTGVAFKNLARVLTFRFPLPKRATKFELVAENGDSGRMEKVLSADVDPAQITPINADPDVKVRVLREATASPKLIVNVYAEGYAAGREEQFFTDALKVPNALAQGRFPKQEHFEFRAVFAPSRRPLGTAANLGLPVPVRDSFLGLYFPYWFDFARYNQILYPTSETKFRRALANVPYDYPIALVDDAQYWGVGNFKELTAVPARNNRFAYLLVHEFGHYFGLNEEYDGGGTELAFSPNVQEPWSQNMTFQTRRDAIKWKDLISAQTPLPTPANAWRDGNYGAYRGGYGGQEAESTAYKPGLACVMDTGRSFCNVCTAAIGERVDIDLGLKSPSAATTTASCGCRKDGDACALFKGDEKLAETALFGGKSCDQSFCDRYFKLTLASSCN